jgi:SAM-dependent methyltransferase
MSLNCTTPKYDELYAAWLTEPAKLLDLGDFKAGDRVLDLCGGTGIVSRAALDRRALDVTLLDLVPRARHLRHLWPIFQEREGHAEAADRFLPHDYFDLVVCRQAIGYLDVEQAAKAVYKVLRADGRFVFNTFERPRWRFKTYLLNDTRYAEASGYLGRTVVHVQAGLGIGVDVTKFRWHHDLAGRIVRVGGFTVDEIHEGRSVLRLCETRSVT